MKIDMSIDPADVARMSRILKRIETELGKDITKITRQGMIYAIQSAAKATAPGTASSPKKLPTKYKYRPIERYRDGINRYELGGKIVTLEQRLSDKSLEARGGKRITRGYRIWRKRSGAWGMIPYSGDITGKWDKESPIARIPHAGAAKGNWLRALGKLGGKSEKIDDQGKLPPPSVRIARRLTEYSIEVGNRVRYISITSPNAARDAMRMAANRMAKAYSKKIKELDKEIIR